jgi:hypothetical protein
MGRPSKFTAEAKQRILEAKRVGASDKTASRVAGIDPATLRDWLKRGKDGAKDSSYAKFLDAFEEAAAHPRERALGIIYNALPDRPDLAWKYVERREDGYAAPIAQPAAVASGPVNIMLSFADTRSAISEVIDVGSTDPAPTEQPALPARATSKPTRSRRKS